MSATALLILDVQKTSSPGGALPVPQGDDVSTREPEPDAEGRSAFETRDLSRLLGDEQVDALTIAGLATEHCVRDTALDALVEGLHVTVDSSPTRGSAPAAARRALETADAGLI